MFGYHSCLLLTAYPSFSTTTGACNSNNLNLFTYASGSIGFGAIFGREWCYGRWPTHWLHRNITILEFYPIVLSLCLWGEKMQNHSILFLRITNSMLSTRNLAEISP